MGLVVWLWGQNCHSSVKASGRWQQWMTMAVLWFTLGHMSWMDEVTVWSVVEFKPHTVIYNIQDYNRNIYRSAHHWWILLVWSFLVNWWIFCLKTGDLQYNHEPSTRFMRSDWLKVKCSDVGVKCKQSHVVKCSVNCQKSTYWHACVICHMT